MLTQKKDVSVLIEQPSEMRVSREIDKKIEAVAGKKFFFSNIGNNHLCIEKKSIEKLNLDDLFAKLDNDRGNAIFDLIRKSGQTIITNTDLVGVEAHGINTNNPNNKTIHLLRNWKN